MGKPFGGGPPGTPPTEHRSLSGSESADPQRRTAHFRQGGAVDWLSLIAGGGRASCSCGTQCACAACALSAARRRKVFVASSGRSPGALGSPSTASLRTSGERRRLEGVTLLLPTAADGLARKSHCFPEFPFCFLLLTQRLISLSRTSGLIFLGEQILTHSQDG